MILIREKYDVNHSTDASLSFYLKIFLKEINEV
jgi:hypothetical protein